MSSTAPTDKHPPPQFSATNVNISGGNNVQAGTAIFNSTNEKVEALKTLQPHTAPDALHSSVAVSRQDSCTPGTRTVTLSNLESLATNSDPGSPDVIWMHGAAGAGKSAIMRTLANTLDERGLLLASFFFFRSESQRNTSRPFIATLTTQAWTVVPATQDNIAQAIQGTPNLFSRPAHRQSPHLLDKPLLAALTPADTPLTIIVDGLDECTDAGGQAEIINAMVQLASTIRASANRRVKIFIASRPEYEIKSRFDALASDPAISIVRLDDSDANLHLYYDKQLDKIRQKFGLPSSWPSKAQIKWLIDKTSGQYSFAGVSMRFMYGGDPTRRLKIIQEALKDDKLRPFEALDQLYGTVFDQLPEDMRITAVHILRCRLHPEWHTSFNPLLELILYLPPGYVHSLRAYLASLIDFDNKMVSYHASLADFLVDPSRSGNFSLYVDDRVLSHTVQRGLLAQFSSDSKWRFSRYPYQGPFGVTHYNSPWSFFAVILPELPYHPHERSPWPFLDNIIEPHPLPSAELFLALKRIDPSLLDREKSKPCYRFLCLLRDQFQSQPLYRIRHPVLWYAIWYILHFDSKYSGIRFSIHTQSGLHIDIPFGMLWYIIWHALRRQLLR